MSLLNHLEFQRIDESPDDIPDGHRPEDEIDLNDQIDEDSLDSFWDQVIKDVHDDPEWFTFADE